MLKEYKISYDGQMIEYDKVKVAINRLKAFEPKEGYFLAYSGGKDSIVILALAKMSGVKFDAHYSVTSVDPPELVRFIKKQKDVSFDIPHDKEGKPISMWSLIANHTMPPTRQVRYCCAELKEVNGKGRITITGVRWAESVKRRKNRGLVNLGNSKKNSIIYNDENDEARRMVESCYRTKKTLVNPIIDWTDDEVWEFIYKYNLEYCELYDKGYKRLGCIGCPMGGTKSMQKEFTDYPKYKKLYINAFGKMLETCNAKGNNSKHLWKTGEDVFKWWINYKHFNALEGQTEMFDDM